MRMSKGVLRASLIGVLVAVALPVVAHWARRGHREGCALDGVKIIPDYRVEIVDNEGHTYEFCCVRCAQLWLARQPNRPRSITVTDEVSKEPVDDAAKAYYVRSSVVTTPATGNRIHVFRKETDAQEHAKECYGAVLSDDEKPFR